MKPLPAALTSDVADYLRGDLDVDFDRRMDLFAALIVADAVPNWMQEEVDRAVDEGDLSPAGDRLTDAPSAP